MVAVLGVLVFSGAFILSVAVIAAMWQAVQGFGFTGGRVLEPSSGIGHFLGAMPAALGLVSVAGQAQSVRPLVAPMAEAAAEKQAGSDAQAERVKALTAATDNVGLFFG